MSIARLYCITVMKTRANEIAFLLATANIVDQSHALLPAWRFSNKRWCQSPFGASSRIYGTAMASFMCSFIGQGILLLPSQFLESPSRVTKTSNQVVRQNRNRTVQAFLEISVFGLFHF